MMTYMPSAMAQLTTLVTWVMYAALMVPLVELYDQEHGTRRVLNPAFCMASIRALVGGVYGQRASRVFPRLMPGFGKTAAADPTEGTARHAMVTMKLFNFFRSSNIPIFVVIFFGFSGFRSEEWGSMSWSALEDG